MSPYSIYDYLAFILPGAMILFVAEYAWFGWPWHEPGATALLGILAAAFITGNLVAALSTWFEPVLLGSSPGSRPDGLWGQFASGDRYAGKHAEIEGLFRKRYGEDVSLETGYALARTEVRNTPESAEGLSTINQQIGFYRGMAVACLAAAGTEAALALGWHTHLFPGVWIPVLISGFILFAYRYRRFWRWYGDYVIRAVQLLESKA